MARLLLLAPLAVALALGCGGFRYGDMQILWYRIRTSLRAVMAVYTLPDKHVQDFLKSYDLFELEQVTGKNNEAANTVNYYQVVNHLCAVGEVEKMYIPPVMDLNVGIFSNQMLWEEKGMADKLGVGTGSKVLDVGCGRGRIAHHVASYTGAHVTGLNIDSTQLSMAKEHANLTGLLDKQLNFVQGNYNDPLPFPDENFDALYQVQVLTYTVDAVALAKEMYRVLKPGAKLSFLDYVQLPDYDETNPKHLDLLKKVKPVLGAVWTPKPTDFTDALEKAGFRVLSSEEASVGGHQWPLIQNAESFFVPVRKLLDFLTSMHLIPKHFQILFERLTRDGEAFIEADKMGLFTTSWQIIAQKPA
mmetsp:Transcript_17254/g.30260  ORF Transcript_17254/g.30260 Transcript_17254/m.30260 type:complete len:360 (+) Transcript_17254:40-1119(+)|eukprot:CAMPEP_0197625966 /NCGR_PEP_ID=MMETSP1338-20131121/5157_1 /TAXON_ID=43686 ORGANISM="Pelagodinium beii, Strain RCC1491" /NCGR_SAMPLE_ID=MMETSP1338 /ASSEMBLY_ACC=CAM_ASM_000754 /LENGTH=359 /DNA_ID=CAMNT_0043196479 /DNA_START=94 /DNA_END=1173 /DNA_ORIENTATION=+